MTTDNTLCPLHKFNVRFISQSLWFKVATNTTLLLVTNADVFIQYITVIKVNDFGVFFSIQRGTYQQYDHQALDNACAAVKKLLKRRTNQMEARQKIVNRIRNSSIMSNNLGLQKKTPKSSKILWSIYFFQIICFSLKNCRLLEM
jgi:hypothetical protein